MPAMERTPEVERLMENGCSILCLDCPEKMLFGIDYAAWTVGPRFMGVKLIPPGLHFVYCSASAEDVGIARVGFFLNMKPKDVAVFRWDPESEELVKPDDLDEEARYADGVRSFDFDSNLGPYPIGLAAEWEELTRHASIDLVAKIEPASRKIRSKRAEYDGEVPAAKPVELVAEPRQPGVSDDGDALMGDNDDGKVPQQPVEAAPSPLVHGPQAEDPAATDLRLESNSGCGHLFWSAVPRIRKARGASPAETTQLHMDRSGQLDHLIAREHAGDELRVIGELQLAYIAFILGQNCDGFEQWRALLQLLCGCEHAVTTRPGLYAELCRAFYAQLSQAPSDLFGDDLTKDSFIGPCALSLLELCGAQTAAPKLRKRCEKLRELVEEKFGISAEDLELLGEDGPQVVDADGRDLIDLASPNLTGLD